MKHDYLNLIPIRDMSPVTNAGIKVVSLEAQLNWMLLVSVMLCQ